MPIRRPDLKKGFVESILILKKQIVHFVSAIHAPVEALAVQPQVTADLVQRENGVGAMRTREELYIRMQRPNVALEHHLVARKVLATIDTARIELLIRNEAGDTLQLFRRNRIFQPQLVFLRLPLVFKAASRQIHHLVEHEFFPI